MDETALRIRVLGDPVLRKNAKPVKEINKARRDILSRMSQLMYDASGVGLAAPQVGINEAMLVADIGSGLYKLVNPKIIKKSGRQALEEGCLSVPGVCVKVKRAKKIIVEALDENAKPITIEAQDLLACVFQHEIDHLYGKMIVDYASLLKRVEIRKIIKTLAKKDVNENLSQSKTKSCRLQL
jgi:peptide deformylase